MHSIRTKLVALCVAAITLAGVAVAQAATSDTFGKSSLEQRIRPDGNTGFNLLQLGDGEGYTVRDGSEGGGTAIGTAKNGRENRRTSISYFGQLTDFQLADEESPARVEFLDPLGGSFTSAWRPQEALTPFEADQMMRQFNHFSTRPPNKPGKGARPKMDFVVNTGDISDNGQYNETLWNRQLLDGETVNPNSGVDPAAYLGKHPLCPSELAPKLAGMNPADYAGVQDRDLWPSTSKAGFETDPAMGYFWDPDDPNPTAANPQWVNPYKDAASWPGLMNRAQKPFQPEGLKVPGRMVFGNHDDLVQGNVYPSEVFNTVATGCLKPINDDQKNSGRETAPLLGLVLNAFLTTNDVLGMYADDPKMFMPVPPDPDRRLLSRKEYMNIFKSGKDKNGYGFGFVDKAEAKASRGYAGYYSFRPRPGIRYIVLDTTAHGGKYPGSDQGNLDNPQFQWFESKLKLAEKNNELAVVFSHHAIPNLTANILDENALPCNGRKPAEDVDPAVVPGCDGDPRFSGPIKLAADAEQLMLKYPNAIAWVAGHSHVNRLTPYRTADGKSGFWSIRTSALADWPKQNRLLEIFDNRDGTLSIFGTLLDHAAPVEVPAPGTDAADFTPEELASIGRTVGFNDSQAGTAGEGQAQDRNAELLINDPRKPRAIINKVTVKPKKRKLKAGKKLKLTVAVSNFQTATAAAKKVRVKFRSSNRRVKVKKVRVINSIPAGATRRIKVVVRANRKARGKAKITVNVAGKKAVSKLNIKPLKKKKKRRGGKKRR